MDSSVEFRLDAATLVVPNVYGAASAAATVGEIVWFERRVAAPGFTARDLSELARWGSHDDRAVIVDDDDFAQLYAGSAPWAAWAIARQDGMLLVWDCVSFADIGRFGCMVDALAALAGAGPRLPETTSNVISLAVFRQRGSVGVVADGAVAEGH